MTSRKKFKKKVHDYWDNESCGTFVSKSKKFSKKYFDEIEKYRYRVEPEIFSFAQFTRHRGEKMLEVGVGAGTDFLQWVRAGAEAHGIDLTKEGVEHVKKRLEIYGLKAKEFKVADCEHIPYEDDTFDLVYSWGVIHHTADTQKALEEIVRVTRPGGVGKIMIYNRYSLVTFFLWVQKALLKGKPWKSLKWCLCHHMESEGTKAFTKREVKKMLKHLPVKDVKIKTKLTYYDHLGHANIHKWFQTIARGIAVICGGDRVGWFLTIYFEKDSKKS